MKGHGHHAGDLVSVTYAAWSQKRICKACFYTQPEQNDQKEGDLWGQGSYRFWGGRRGGGGREPSSQAAAVPCPPYGEQVNTQCPSSRPSQGLRAGQRAHQALGLMDTLRLLKTTSHIPSMAPQRKTREGPTPSCNVSLHVSLVHVVATEAPLASEWFEERF